MVEMGVDRYHGFWKLMDREHRKHEPGNRFEHAIFDYHRHVDELMGRLLAHTDEDTAVFVVSDHGASAWTAAFASTSGCAGRASSRRSPAPTPRCLCARRGSTGPRRRPG